MTDTMELTTLTGTRLATDVKDKFSDVGQVQITDTMLLRWINDGCRKISSEAPWLKESASTNLLAGQTAYDFATYFPAARIQQFDSIVVDSKPAQVVTFSEYLAHIEGNELQDVQGSPWIVTRYAGTLTLWPVPQESIASGIRLYYTAYPAEQTDLTTVLPVPDRFYNTLKDYVLAQALELDKDFEASQIKLAHHEQSLRREFERENQSPTDYYPTVTDDTTPYGGI